MESIFRSILFTIMYIGLFHVSWLFVGSLYPLFVFGARNEESFHCHRIIRNFNILCSSRIRKMSVMKMFVQVKSVASFLKWNMKLYFSHSLSWYKEYLPLKNANWERKIFTVCPEERHIHMGYRSKNNKSVSYSVSELSKNNFRNIWNFHCTMWRNVNLSYSLLIYTQNMSLENKFTEIILNVCYIRYFINICYYKSQFYLDSCRLGKSGANGLSL